jgi:mRNA interferase HigB
MHVITRKRLLEFGGTHPDAITPLDVWYRLVKAGQFGSWAALKETFRTADNLGKGLVVFDIGGNKYRLVAYVRYTSETSVGRAWVQHVFTHAEYDDWSNRRRTHGG